MVTGSGTQQKTGRGTGSVAFTTFPGAVSGSAVLNPGSERLSDPGQALWNLRVFLLICKMEVTCCEGEQREFCKAMVTNKGLTYLFLFIG